VHAALLLLTKDLRLRLRDRSVLLFGVGVPLGLTVLFAFIIPDTGDLQVVAAVVDEDGGDVGAAFTDEMLPALIDDGVVVPRDAADRAAVRRGLQDGELDAAWIVPAGFSDEVQAGRGGELEVLVNPDRTLPAEVARGIATAFASQLTSTSLAAATATVASGGELSEEELARVVASAAAATPVVVLDDLVTADRQLDAVSYLAAGMAAFFVFFTVQFGVTGLLEERKQGTLPRLLAAPVPPWTVQVGKALGAFVVGLGSLTVLAVASAVVLGADWGPPLAVALLLVALVVAAVGLMGFVGSFARTAEQAGNAQAIVAIVLGMVGGVFFPIPSDSLLLRVLSAGSPHAWFLRGLGDATATGEWTAALPAAAAISAFGLVAAVPAAWLLRRAHRW
jgi:ABC-2 type transport system permease protein